MQYNIKKCFYWNFRKLYCSVSIYCTTTYYVLVPTPTCSSSLLLRQLTADISSKFAVISWYLTSRNFWSSNNLFKFSYNTMIMGLQKMDQNLSKFKKNRLISKSFTNFIVCCLHFYFFSAGRFDIIWCDLLCIFESFFFGIFWKSDQKLKTFEIQSFKLWSFKSF